MEKIIFQARPAGATDHQIDLGAHYNLPLAMTSPQGEGLAFLSLLPTGLQSLGGVWFDVRGSVQLQGLAMAKSHPELPLAVNGIRANIMAHRLHFLGALNTLPHAFPQGTPVGQCVVHYEDGRQAEFPWRAWLEFDNEWFNPRSIRDHTDSNVVWVGLDADAEVANNRVRLMMATWENPWPDVKIASLDLRSDNQVPAPLIVAITAG